MSRAPRLDLFADGKEPDALRTIGEVAEALAIKQHVLRYWEQQFSTLRPLKRSGGRRYYRPADVAMVCEIDRLVNREGYTLKGARQALARAGSAPPQSNAPVPQDAAEEMAVPGVISRLRAIRERLASALEA